MGVRSAHPSTTACVEAGALGRARHRGLFWRCAEDWCYEARRHKGCSPSRRATDTYCARLREGYWRLIESKIRHLEMLQGVVNRMANNCFLLKAWSVVLVSALFALATNGGNGAFVWVAYFPALAFWLLDGYFLRQEKLFRKLYDKVRGMEDTDVDFSMDTSCVAHEEQGWLRAALSLTLCIFHGAILGALLVVTLVMVL